MFDNFNVMFQVPASYAITLLQSDIKLALKSAFGNFDGPLSVMDWCKGRNGQIDGFSAESSASINDCRDSSSTPTSPSQSAGGSTSCLSKGSKYFYSFSKQ